MATADDYAKWIVDNAAKKGTPEFDTVATAYREAVAEESTAKAPVQKPASVQAGGALNDIPRQVGLTARYGMEGLGNAAQLVTEPLRYVTDRVTGSTGKTVPLGVLATQGADWLGLPKPQGANERVVGEATKLMAGAGGFGAIGNAASGVSAIAPEVSPAATSMAGKLSRHLSDAVGIAKTKIPEMFAANPLQQVTSAAGAGLAGGASKEAGGSPILQGVSSLVGGIVGGKAPDIAMGTANVAKRLLNVGMSPQQLDVKINEVLRRTGVDYSQVPERIKQSLRSDMASSLNADKELNPEAVSRLLAFKEAGLTPTRGMISQNPVQITREQNLAKIGANANDAGLQGLALVQNQNNQKLVNNLNSLGANRGNLLNAGESVASSVIGRQASLRGAEQAAWDAAKNSPGYRQPISSKAISDINGALGEQGLMPFMNPAISRYMEAFQKGQPFTPQDYRNLQSMLSRETAKGGNEGAAASLAARILRDAELQPAGFANANNSLVTQATASGMRNADNAASNSIDAVNRARQATRAAYAFEDSNPLVRSVLSGGASSDPERIARRFVIGGTANEAQDMVQQVGPQGLPAVKDALLNHLKSKAVNGASDETAKFSQSAFNKALNDIGERKLELLFTPEEVRALRNNGRVAALMQSQPVGSAVNNSNSGALLLGKGLDFLDKMPVLGPMVTPALKNIEISYGNRQAQKILPGLLADKDKLPAWQKMIGPGAAIGGLLAAP